MHMVSKAGGLDEKRNSALELLRILATAGVVLLHYNNAGIGGGFRYVPSESMKELYLIAIESLCVCAVDIFVMISGYFLCMTGRRKLIRVVELFLQLVFMQLAGYCSEVLTGISGLSPSGLLRCFVPANYYVIFYAVMYIVSPYINLLISNLELKKFRKLLIILLVAFSFWNSAVDALESFMSSKLYGLSTINYSGSEGGMTIINFLLMYCIGAYIRKADIHLSVRHIMLAIAVIFFIETAISRYQYRSGAGAISAWYYYNPLIIALAALSLLMVCKFRFYSSAVNTLAKVSFTCYLTHSYLLKWVGIEYAVNRPVYELMIHQFITVVLAYALSFILFHLYSFAAERIIKAVTPMVNKLNISLE